MKLTLDADAADLLLQLAGSPRKQGEYVSRLIRGAALGALDMDRVVLAEKIALLEQQLARVGGELTLLKTELGQRYE